MQKDKLQKTVVRKHSTASRYSELEQRYLSSCDECTWTKRTQTLLQAADECHRHETSHREMHVYSGEAVQCYATLIDGDGNRTSCQKLSVGIASRTDSEGRRTEYPVCKECLRNSEVSSSCND